MNSTIIELEFIEFPWNPDTAAGVQVVQPLSDSRHYLLSMWDCTARLAWWNGDTAHFEDAGGLLNSAAIRSWAALPRPLDHPTWGPTVAAAAKSCSREDPRAGWLKPTYLLANCLGGDGHE